MLSPLPRRSGWAYLLRSFTQPYQPSPKWLSGRPAHCPFRGLLGVHSRYGLHTRAVTVFRDTLSEGFSHFVTSMTAPVASGWSGCRVGLAPTGKRRLSTAHGYSGRASREAARQLLTQFGSGVCIAAVETMLLCVRGSQSNPRPCLTVQRARRASPANPAPATKKNPKQSTRLGFLS